MWEGNERESAGVGCFGHGVDECGTTSPDEGEEERERVEGIPIPMMVCSSGDGDAEGSAREIHCRCHSAAVSSPRYLPKQAMLSGGDCGRGPSFHEIGLVNNRM